LKTVTNGLVIKETNLGEADRLITILTADNGIIKAYASGAKSIKSKRGSATGLLSYSNFALSKKGDTYRVSEATPIKIFFGAGEDIYNLTVAQYFCELCSVFEPSGNSAEEFLRLVLNSLYFLTEKKKPPLILKAITEFRIAAISGYCPSLVACDTCGKFEDGLMHFDLSNGKIYCNDCNTENSNIKINKTVMTAMRHIVYSPFERLYSFNIPKDYEEALSDVTERYIVYQTDRKFTTLEFLKLIK